MQLYSKISGEGIPLIIMHGVFGMSDNWQSLGRQWSKMFEVHLLDMRNHGRSPHSEAFSYELMSDDLEEYMDRQQLESAILLGHSMGGKVAMLFASLRPERVSHLIVADIAPRAYPPHHDSIVEAMQALPLSELSSRSEAEEAFAIKDEATRQFLLKNLYWKQKDQLDWRFNLPVVAASVKESNPPLPAQAVYDGPTLFIRGGASDYIQDSDREDIAAHFPSAQIETIEEAGHWVHAAKPREFFKCVNAFLREEGALD